ncbi:hypothetical protein H2200_012755 [Cladophialophora chaetospira]|uniref:Uncharacterized protein n=1 Tax=Cladophialophora chaetospira TaxID=386627 RepID=A0AA39CCA8_9EURO|nr:hypothetical protein H2200_012755 [Cladophialophora chaetospira]
MAISQSASPNTITTGKVTVAMVAIWGFFYNGLYSKPSLAALKGRSLEEIDELFEKRVGVFKFKNYQTEIQEKALHDVQINTGAFLDKKPVVNHVEIEQPEVKVE